MQKKFVKNKNSSRVVNCFSTVSIGLVPVPICVTFVISAGDNTYNKRIHDIITAFIRHLTTSMGVQVVENYYLFLK